MAMIPAAKPDAQRIRELVAATGLSQADFARTIGRPPRSLYGLLNDNPPRQASIPFIRQIARGLHVKPSDISDWTGDDDVSDPETDTALSA